MPKNHISLAAFVAVLVAAMPTWADDQALTQSVNDLNQKIQDQQQQIDSLKGELAKKPKAKKAAAAQATANAKTAAPQKPIAVAPLQPSSLGTLRMSEIAGGPSVVAAPQPPVIVPVGSLSNPQSVNSAPAPRQVAVVATPASVPAVPAAASGSSGTSPAYVGQAPASSGKPPEVQALASVGGVLTPYGRAVIEPFLQYSESSVNAFAFDGVQVIPAFLIGTVAANVTNRDLIESGATVRLGVSNRAEIEARVPFVYRADSLTDTIPNTNAQFNTTNATGYGLGDIEVAGHYQINDGQNDWPFFIANLRYKSDSGTSPYDVKYNSDGSERILATGSGFNAVEPSLTAIYPSDPATLFANLGYIHSFGENVDHMVAGAHVGDVTPGDTYIASVGMGMALNDRLSFTLGYEHDYVLPTTTVIGGISQNSATLQMGSALTGVSYKIDDTKSINLSVAAGVTPDAPNVVIGVRVPIALQVF